MTTVTDISVPAAPWSAGELAALEPVEELTPAEWAERHRWLSREQSDRYGPLQHANAPYLVGIINLCVCRRVRELWIEKAAQIGISEALRCVIGYWADREPDPVLLVLPDEQKGREVIGDRLIPLFMETPVLRALHTGLRRDVKLSAIHLANGFVLRLGYSGSPSALATHPARRVINDEVDRFQPFSGREADPLSLARQRTKTYGERASIINISTPNTADGMIHSGRELCPIQLRYYVPCPHCGHWQVLRFGQLRYAPAGEGESREGQAERIKASQAAWYECEKCAQQITERQKPAIVRRGVWATEQAARRADFAELAAAAGDGIVFADWPVGQSVGIQINELCCLFPGAAFWETAGDWVAAQGSFSKLMDFRNGRLGEPMQEQIARIKPDVFAAKSAVAWPPGELPEWAQRVLVAVDVQLDHCYVVVRAWGYGLQSRRIWHGSRALPRNQPEGWNDLQRFGLETIWPFAERSRPGLAADLLAIDEKFRSDEVLLFSLRNPVRIKAMAGSPKPLSQLVWRKAHVYNRPDQRRRPIRGWLHLMDTGRLKDWLAGAIGSSIGRPDPQTGELIEEDLWQLNGVNDPEYNRQMAAEHKIPVRRGFAQPVERWQPITEGARNHYWDCEYMERAAAFVAQVELLQPLRADQPRPARPPHEREMVRKRPRIRRRY